MSKFGDIAVVAKRDVKVGEEFSIEDAIPFDDLCREFDLFKEFTKTDELWVNRTKMKVNINSLATGLLASFETTPATHRVKYQLPAETNLIFMLSADDLAKKFKASNEIRKGEGLEIVFEEVE